MLNQSQLTQIVKLDVEIGVSLVALFYIVWFKSSQHSFYLVLHAFIVTPFTFSLSACMAQEQPHKSLILEFRVISWWLAMTFSLNFLFIQMPFWGHH